MLGLVAAGVGVPHARRRGATLARRHGFPILRDCGDRHDRLSAFPGRRASADPSGRGRARAGAQRAGVGALRPPLALSTFTHHSHSCPPAAAAAAVAAAVAPLAGAARPAPPPLPLPNTTAPWPTSWTPPPRGRRRRPRGRGTRRWRGTSRRSPRSPRRGRRRRRARCWWGGCRTQRCIGGRGWRRVEEALRAPTLDPRSRPRLSHHLHPPLPAPREPVAPAKTWNAPSSPPTVPPSRPASRPRRWPRRPRRTRG